MRPLAITWVYEAHDSPMFHLGHDEQFVQAIGRHAGITIPLIEGNLRDVAPTEGFVLLNSFRATDSLETCPRNVQSALAQRLIAIDASRSRIFERMLEPWSLAAAVDATSHSRWKDGEKASGATGLYGLRAIAERINAPTESGGSERYAYLLSDGARDLPRLIAEYLIALHAVRAADPPS